LLVLKRKPPPRIVTGSGFESFVVIPGYSLIASSFRITIAIVLPSCQWWLAWWCKWWLWWVLPELISFSFTFLTTGLIRD